MQTSVVDPVEMRRTAEQASAVLSALSNPDRLLLLCQISLGEQSVSQIEEALAIRQPTLSQQLGVLRTQELVTTRREGKRIFYSIADQKILSLLNLLHELYCQKD